MIVLGCCLYAFTGLSVASAVASSPQLVRVGARPALPPGARTLGALAGATRLEVTVTLRPRDPAALAAYATAVATPGSAVYHHYLTVAQFAQRFGPSAGQIGAVDSALRSQGLSPGAVSANGLAIDVRATAVALAHAFSIGFRRVVLPGGRNAFANTAAPSLAASVVGDVQGVVGLDTLAVPRPVSLVRARTHAAAPAVTPDVVTGGPQPCTTAKDQAPGNFAYTADQLASAYSFSSLYGAGDEGAGQTVALYELEPYDPNDIAAYQTCYKTSATVTSVLVDGGAGSGSGSGEAALDIEDVIGLAPKASILVYQGPNTDSGAIDTYNAIISQDTASVISTSWGLCESQEGSDAAQAENTLFQEAATQGQTIVAAAGDDGSEDCFPQNSTLSVDDPGSQPYVTSVGGTSLTALGPPPTESVWNDECSEGACGGGGGISSLWPMPPYQSGAPGSLNVINPNSSGTRCGATTGSYCREVPDVAADADPGTGYLIYYDGDGRDTDAAGWTGIGGTSAAAPLWAALIALTNASSACSGAAVGFLNPDLYSAAASGYANDFNDITSGNNDITGSNGGLYPAGPGYDMASGLGTPNGANLPAALCGGASPGANKVTVTNPGDQSSTLGSPVSVPVSAIDSGSAPLTYSATGLPAGVSIDSSSGLISGTPTADGTSNASVMATDSTGAFGVASFTWSVTQTPNTVTVTSPGNQTGAVGTPVSVQVTGTDSGGDSLTFSATGLPAGLSISSSGLISGTPTLAGGATATVTATDATGGQGSATFTWTVNPRGLDTVVVANPGNQAGAVGARVAVQLIAIDSGGAPLAFTATGLPSGLSITAGGLISGAPRTAGRSTATVTAVDSTGASAAVSFTWSVAAAASAPRGSLAAVGKGKPKLMFSVVATSGSPPIAAIVIGAPKGLSFSSRAKNLAKGIVLKSPGGGRLKFAAAVRGRALRIVLIAPQAGVQVAVSSLDLAVGKSLRKQVARGHVKTLSFTLQAIDSAGDTTLLGLKLGV